MRKAASEERPPPRLFLPGLPLQFQGSRIGVPPSALARDSRFGSGLDSIETLLLQAIVSAGALGPGLSRRGAGLAQVCSCFEDVYFGEGVRYLFRFFQSRLRPRDLAPGHLASS